MTSMSRCAKIRLTIASALFAVISVPFGCLIAANQTSVYSSHAAVLSPAYVTAHATTSVTEIDQNMKIPSLQNVALRVETK